MGSPWDLDRRLSKKLEADRGIQLSAEDLNMLAETGAIDLFRSAIGKMQRDQCRQRNARSRSISGGNIASIAERVEQTSKSSGTTPSEDASAALARAQAIVRPASKR